MFTEICLSFPSRKTRLSRPLPPRLSPPLPPRLSRPLPPRLNRPLPISRWVLDVNLHESLYVVCVCRQIKSAPGTERACRVQMSQIFTCISLISLYYTHSGKRPEAATLKEAEAGRGEGRHSWCGQLHCEEWAPGPCQRVAATPEAEWWRQRDAAKSAGLTDNLINTTQLLLKKASPHVSGLQDVTRGLVLSFDVEPGEFIQILNNRRGHWFTVSTIGCPHPTVSVYGNLYRSAGTRLKSQIASLLHTQQSTIELNFMDCQIQSGGCDCGLFAIANTMALVLGDDPNKLFFDQVKMRQHLYQCLEKGCF